MGVEVAFPLGRDAAGNALPLGWAHLGTGLARTSLALSEDPSIFALVLLPPFVYLECLPPEMRPAWLKEAAESIHKTHFAPFHGAERLVEAAYAALVLPPPAPQGAAPQGAAPQGAAPQGAAPQCAAPQAPQGAASQPISPPGKYVPPHMRK